MEKPQHHDLTLRRDSWLYAVKRTVREFSRDGATDLAAALTYYAVLSLVPGLLAMLSLLSLVSGGAEARDWMVKAIGTVSTPEMGTSAKELLTQLGEQTGAGWTLLLGLLGALWSASAYVGAFGRALNRTYSTAEGRPMWKLRPQMYLLTLVIVVLAVLALALLVLSGPVARGIGDVLGLGEATLLAWNIAKWPVLVLIAVFMVALLYHFTPNIRKPRFRWISAGSLGALLVLALTTAGFFFYVSWFGTYQSAYGALAGVIILLLWIWLANISLLLGSELDAELERARELRQGLAVEDELALPARDDTGIAKARLAMLDDQQDARALRIRAGGEAHPDVDLPGPRIPWGLLAGTLGAVGAYLAGRRHGAGR
ncbi:ribonuclease BN [Arthrobacter sp. AQ5-05]|uniref:YihY/virulence factor BrkB family protein n=1 Tax=Arthrobacter sp. AQ5-05 TaxID=2184581 RepID=UPI000DCEF6E5|nr:YihY/virulence factor BrkB family protein [Arthrobacter sp. AQ5-05]RAX48675.1 ribonuclease BN [Arthrobacter sp. AQ5-05]